MAFEDLTQLEIVEGTFGLIWVIFAVIIGLRIILKAINLTRKELITTGLTYIFLSSAWWGVAVQFISFGFLDLKLGELTYLFIANVFIPLAVVCWVYSICESFYQELKKKLLIITSIFCFIWEFFLIYHLITNPALVGRLEGIFNSTHSTTSLIFILTALVIFQLGSLTLAIKSMRSDNPEIQWKGRFLLIGGIAFTIGALLDAALTLTVLTITLIRLVLIVSGIAYYLGFFLPKKLSNKLIPQKER